MDVLWRDDEAILIVSRATLSPPTHLILLFSASLQDQMCVTDLGLNHHASQ